MLTAWLVVAAIYTGLLVATSLIGIIWHDLLAKRRGWKTFSRETLLLSRRFPAVALVFTGIAAFVLGCLVGHLFLAQTL